jgi:surface carbohydrate biosynthesis protein
LKIQLKKPTLIIPVENQIRELNPKLLLASIAADRGFKVFIGDRQEIKSKIASFPIGIFVAKDMMAGNDGMFRIIRKLGHVIVAWDEDSLVHLPPETYYCRRISPNAVRCVSHLFAWGEDNAELWEKYPELPSNIPIHITGNPRADLLRKEVNHIFTNRVKELNNKYGSYILINTNFNHVNAFIPNRNLLTKSNENNEKLQLGRMANGMSRDYAEGLYYFKKAVFQDFIKLIPKISATFPGCNIIIRPHPVESTEVYKNIASKCNNVHVTNSGNVVPWLMASKVLVHNSCTTGVEAFALGIPSITFRATINEKYDMGFYGLSNALSYQCLNYSEIEQTIKSIYNGTMKNSRSEDQLKLFNRHLASQEGPLSCERIMDIIEKEIVNKGHKSSIILLKSRLEGWVKAKKRARKRIEKSQNKNGLNKQEFLNHRYPGISLHEMYERIAGFSNVIANYKSIKVKAVYNNVFRISS